MVIANDPLLEDGTPMPTLFWLVDPELKVVVGRLESVGAIDEVEAAVDPVALEDAHQRYARQRDLLLPDDHAGARPSGGVGGTRVGVKCLHAHLAWWLVGGADPVGDWMVARLRVEGVGDLTQLRG